MENENKPQDARSGIANYVVEAVVATLIIVLGLVVLQGSWKLGSKWTTDGPGSGYFPFYIGVLMCIAGAGALYQALMARERDRQVFVDREQLTRVLQVLIPAVIYVVVVQLIGLYVASALYIAGFMIILGKYSPLKSAITAVCINVVFFLMFEVWFKVPLFKGMFDPLSFLGY